MARLPWKLTAFLDGPGSETSLDLAVACGRNVVGPAGLCFSVDVDRLGEARVADRISKAISGFMEDCTEDTGFRLLPFTTRILLPGTGHSLLMGVNDLVRRGKSIGYLRSGLTAFTLTVTGKPPSTSKSTVDVKTGKSVKVIEVAYPRPP